MLVSRQLPNFLRSCRSTLIPLWLFFTFAGNHVAAAPPVHVREKQEVTFRSARTWANPYTDVTVWVDLKGPNFRKSIYGFWDGERTFRVRFLATVPGEWKWESGSWVKTYCKAAPVGDQRMPPIPPGISNCFTKRPPFAGISPIFHPDRTRLY
jgi:hypothetical protein